MANAKITKIWLVADSVIAAIEGQDVLQTHARKKYCICILSGSSLLPIKGHYQLRENDSQIYWPVTSNFITTDEFLFSSLATCYFLRWNNLHSREHLEKYQLQNCWNFGAGYFLFLANGNAQLKHSGRGGSSDVSGHLTWKYVDSQHFNYTHFGDFDNPQTITRKEEFIVISYDSNAIILLNTVHIPMRNEVITVQRPVIWWHAKVPKSWQHLC